MSNLLQMDAFAKNSLNRLSTEIKEMIVAMVELQDVAYETRQRTRVGYGGMLADLSRVEFSDERDVENLVGEEYAVAVKGSAAMGDERRKWRRLLGKGTSSVFRVNREFAALAAPHLFKVSPLLVDCTIMNLMPFDRHSSRVRSPTSNAPIVDYSPNFASNISRRSIWELNSRPAMTSPIKMRSLLISLLGSRALVA